MALLTDIPLPGNAGAPYVDNEDFLAAIGPADLVYFVLSVGNADTQLLVLPEDDTGTRHMVVVDVGTVHQSKLPALIDDLSAPPAGAAPLLDVNDSRVRLLIATHPHGDHVGGIPDFLAKKGPLLVGGEIWDPGYYHSTGAWHQMMHWLETNPEVARIHPTAGTRRHIGTVAITALSPAIRLRNNFDTYGVHINNSSIAAMIEFPMRRVFTGQADTFASGRQDRSLNRQRLLLGADAQTLSWSHVNVDFPTLIRDHDPTYRILGQARGQEPLAAHVLKIPHHCSKYGLNLEFVERVHPTYSLISCKAATTGHAFPHEVALNQLREALNRRATAAPPNNNYPDDWDPTANIITTADHFTNGDPLGTIAMIMTPSGLNRGLYRLRDQHNQRIDPNQLIQTLKKVP